MKRHLAQYAIFPLQVLSNVPPKNSMHCVSDTVNTAGAFLGSVEGGSTNMTMSCTITWVGVDQVMDGAQQRLSQHLSPRSKSLVCPDETKP